MFILFDLMTPQLLIRFIIYFSCLHGVDGFLNGYCIFQSVQFCAKKREQETCIFFFLRNKLRRIKVILYTLGASTNKKMNLPDSLKIRIFISKLCNVLQQNNRCLGMRTELKLQIFLAFNHFKITRMFPYI